VWKRLVLLLRRRADRHLPEHLRDARRGEDLAYAHVRGLGYQIVARNYRPRNQSGEIDLLGWDGDQLAVVEVKTRAGRAFGDPQRAVDMVKRQRLIRAARDYARRAGLTIDQLRFDVVSVLLDADPPTIELFKDAFSPRFPRGRRQWRPGG
jgi:putative endonuclease